MRSAFRFIAVLAVTGSAVGDDHPLSDSEKEAVGGALSTALGVLSGKAKSGSKFSICSNLFADGPPADAATDASWQACKNVLPSTSGSLLAYRQAVVKKGGAKHPLSGSEKASVGAALSKALGVMSGKIKGGSKEQVCAEMFPTGAPADAATSVTWNSCKSAMGYRKSALISSKQLRDVKKVAAPLTTGERAAVGDALETALGVISGKVKAGDKFSICSNMFPNGPPSDAATSATWASCKDSLPSVSSFGSLISWKQAVVSKGGAKHPLSEREKTAVGDALGEALGVMSGKVKSGSKSSICADIFRNGAPPDAATSSTWAACKDSVYN